MAEINQYAKPSLSVKLLLIKLFRVTETLTVRDHELLNNWKKKKHFLGIAESRARNSVQALERWRRMFIFITAVCVSQTLGSGILTSV